MPTLSDRWFAWLLPRISGPYDEMLAGRKQRLLSELRGIVVEIGPGNGANLKYYSPEARLVGIEPNLCLYPDIRREAAARKIAIDLRLGAAEHLDFVAAKVDAVVSTSVLCSVRDVDACLEEARRVLKPGGRFVFIEHVAAPAGTALALLQRAITPVWSCCAAGCHPDRDIAAHIRRVFPSVRMEHFRLPLGPVAPHIAGVANR